MNRSVFSCPRAATAILLLSAITAGPGPSRGQSITITASAGNPRNTTGVGYYYVPIKTDLANSGQSSFLSLTTTYPTDWNNGVQARLNDGNPAGDGYGSGKWNSAHYSGGPFPAVQTFAFNTNANPAGYDISAIISASADWRDGRTWQKYNVEYHTVVGGWASVPGDDPANTNTVNRPGDPGGQPQQSLVTIERLALTHVDQLRFTTPQNGGCTAWNEIDILGAASGASEIPWSSSGDGAWEAGANWSGGTVPGAADTAIFNGAGSVLAVLPDADRAVRNILFDTAGAGAYVIGAAGGNALTLSSGGAIRTAQTVLQPEAVNAPLAIAGPGGIYTFTSDASNTTAALNIGGSLSGGAAGTTLLMLNGANAGDNTLAGNLSNGSATQLALAKHGTGRWVLSGNNTYSGTTTIGGGLLQANSATALGSGDITFAGGTLQFGPALGGTDVTWGARLKSSILSGAIILDSNGQDVRMDGNIPSSNTGGLTKLGAGSLTLSGNNAYAGTTLVNGGTLVLSGTNTYAAATTVNAGAALVGVTGGGCAGSAITVAAGGTLGIRIGAAGGQWTCAALTCGATGTALAFDFGTNVPSSSTAPLRINGNVAFSGVPAVSVAGSAFAVGTIPLMTWTGTRSGTLPSAAALPPSVSGFLALSDDGKALNLIVASSTPPIRWAAGDGNWDINISANWKDGGGAFTTYLEGSSVIFDETYSTSTNIAVMLSGILNPAFVAVSNATTSYALRGGGIGGTAGLIKSGPGTLTLACANTYSNPTFIDAGTLKLGIADALPGGAGKGAVTLTGTLDLNGFNQGINGLNGGGTVSNSAGFGMLTVGRNDVSSTFSGRLLGGGGTLALTKTGAGILVLSGTANTYTGGTTVEGGLLQIAGDFSLGSVPAAAQSNSVTLVNGTTLQKTISGNTTLAANRGITLGSGRQSIMNGGSGWLRIDGVISGAGGLDIRSDIGNDIRLQGANTHTGDTRLYSNMGLLNVLALQNSTLDYNSYGGQLNYLTTSGFTDVTFGGLKGAQNLDIGSVRLWIGRNNASTAYGGVLSGAGGKIVKTGAGSLTLSGANTYGGGTTVSNGTLLVSNATGSGTGTGAVAVNTGGTLGGTGIVAGAVTVEAGGHLAPGGTGTVGTLTLAGANTSLVFTNGAVLDCELNSTTNDLVSLAGTNSTIAFGSTATLKLSVVGGATAGTTSVVLFQYTGSDPVLPAWTIDYGTTGRSGGMVIVDPDKKQVVLAGLEPMSGAALIVK